MSTIFANMLFDGKCQNVQNTPTHVALALAVSDIITILKCILKMQAKDDEYNFINGTIRWQSSKSTNFMFMTLISVSEIVKMVLELHYKLYDFK